MNSSKSPEKENKAVISLASTNNGTSTVGLSPLKLPADLVETASPKINSRHRLTALSVSCSSAEPDDTAIRSLKFEIERFSQQNDQLLAAIRNDTTTPQAYATTTTNASFAMASSSSQQQLTSDLPKQPNDVHPIAAAPHEVAPVQNKMHPVDDNNNNRVVVHDDEDDDLCQEEAQLDDLAEELRLAFDHASSSMDPAVAEQEIPVQTPPPTRNVAATSPKRTMSLEQKTTSTTSSTSTDSSDTFLLGMTIVWAVVAILMVYWGQSPLFQKDVVPSPLRENSHP